MHGAQFCGFKLSINVSPRDVIEWLHVIHGLNELSINVFPCDVHGMSELFAIVFPRVIPDMNELFVDVCPSNLK